jgi:hypothetical protein
VALRRHGIDVLAEASSPKRQPCSLSGPSRTELQTPTGRGHYRRQHPARPQPAIHGVNKAWVGAMKAVSEFASGVSAKYQSAMNSVKMAPYPGQERTRISTIDHPSAAPERRPGLMIAQHRQDLAMPRRKMSALSGSKRFSARDAPRFPAISLILRPAADPPDAQGSEWRPGIRRLRSVRGNRSRCFDI